MRGLFLIVALVSTLAMAQPRTGGSGIKANCPSCALIDATITSNGNLIAGATTANFITFAGAASGAASTMTVSSSDHTGKLSFLVDNDFNTGNPTAFFFNTNTTKVGSSTYIANFAVNNSSVFNVDVAGTGTFANNLAISENTQMRFNGASSTTWIEGLSATHNLAMQSNVTNASTNAAYVMDTANALSGTTSLLVLKNNTAAKLTVDNAGNLLSASHLSCAMSAGTTCTATVPTGSACMCQATAGSASAFSCAVSSTTATCTASGANSSTWNVFVY